MESSPFPRLGEVDVAVGVIAPRAEAGSAAAANAAAPPIKTLLREGPRLFDSFSLFTVSSRTSHTSLPLWPFQSNGSPRRVPLAAQRLGRAVRSVASFQSSGL